MKSNNMQLELTLCPVCGSGDFDIEFHRQDLNVMLPGCFRVVRCRDCSHMYLNPRPSTESIQNDIYPKEYDQYIEIDLKFSIQKIIQKYGFHKRYRYISKFVSSGSLLDVGCSTGEFIRYMNRFPGWNVVGLEPIPKAAHIAREHQNITIENNILTEFTFDANKFDVITFWHVFEHIEDPVNTLKIVNKILRNDGIIVITLPILKSIDHKLFGKYWIGFEVPRHLHFFSKEKMIELLSAEGFCFLESRCLYGSHAMTMTSLKFFIRSNKIFSEKTLNGLMKVLMSIPIRLILSPVFYLFDSLQLSTPVTFVAKKCEK